MSDRYPPYIGRSPRGCQVRKVTALIAVAGLLVFGLAACGSDDDSGGSSGGGGSAAAKCSKSTSGEFAPVKADTLTVVDQPPGAGLLER